MANLAIDIGNTLTKIAVFQQNELVHFEYAPDMDAQTLLQLIDKYEVKRAIVSCLRKRVEPWQEAVESKIEVKYFSVDMTGGVKNRYKSPRTLGIDRLAAVIAAHRLYPGKSSLVIDAGTTITYDHVDAAGNYFGGSISPGLNMRYKALNYYTGALPLLDADDKFSEDYGYDTASAIRSGVQNGLKYELLGFIKSYQAKEPELNIILTGGDGIFLILY